MFGNAVTGGYAFGCNHLQPMDHPLVDQRQQACMLRRCESKEDITPGLVGVRFQKRNTTVWSNLSGENSGQRVEEFLSVMLFLCLQQRFHFRVCGMIAFRPRVCDQNRPGLPKGIPNRMEDHGLSETGNIDKGGMSREDDAFLDRVL